MFPISFAKFRGDWELEKGVEEKYPDFTIINSYTFYKKD